VNNKSIYKTVRIIKVYCAIMLLMASALGHAADPTQLPLLDSSDITYVGSFNLPDPPSGNFDYGGMGLSVSADGKTLYVGGHVYDQSLGRVAIPDPIGGTASLIQAPVNVPGSIGGSCGSNVELAGTLIYNGRLIVQKRCYYDNNGSVGNTHAVGASNISNFSSFTRLDNLPTKQFASGYMGLIPAEWQSLLGGPAFTGNSSMSIISQCSNGPSFYVFNPDDVGVKSPIPSIPLMYYPLSNPLAPDVANDIWIRADTMNAGIVFPSGTRSVLFFSTHGYGPRTYKVPDGGCGGESGNGAAPYRRQITAFDANDLLAVKNGKKNPWEIRPYAWWVVPGPTETCATFRYSGLAYDPTSRRIFGAFHYGSSPEIHVWKVSGEPGEAPPSPPKNLQVLE